MKQTPNFYNWRAVILHRPDATTDKLTRQLQLFGFMVETFWQPLATDQQFDLVVVDADQGWNGLLPWATPQTALCPLVALLGSEAPSRVSWAYEQGAGAILAKPLNTSAVYPALIMAVAVHSERAASRDQINRLEERVRLRPLVVRAVEALAAQRKITEDEALGLLRARAMHQRQMIEVLAAEFLAGHDGIAEAV